MNKYIGVKCPVCEKNFTENDDIVVCPICGAPYHRHCYTEKGECIFTDLHESDKAWEAPEAPELKTAPAYEIKDQECPHCGVLNSHSSIFCSNCKQPLKIEPQMHNNDRQQNQYAPPITFGTSAFMDMFDPMGGVVAGDLIDENVTYGEVSKVVQQNTKYYMPAFKNLKERKKNKFNLTAFVFTGGWLLYRKQYKSGIFVTVLMFLLYIAQTVSAVFFSLPKIYGLLKELGDPLTNTGLTASQIALLSENLKMEDMLIIGVPSLMLFLMFLVMLIVGFNANKMYMKHCIKSVNKVRNTTINSEDYDTRILEIGGINSAAALCVLVCYMIVTYLPNFLF